MSTFTNYDHISNYYDNGRRAAASDVIAGILTMQTKKALKDIKLLDAGCGTGIYAADLVKLGARDLTLYDASNGMLDKAKKKMEALQDRVTFNVQFKQGSLPELPFKENSFDAVMINMVLHHLEKSPDGKNFPEAQKTFAEVHRVLKPGGVLTVTWSTPLQEAGFWFCHLAPEALPRYQKKQLTHGHMIRLLTSQKLHVQSLMAYLGSDWLDRYDDPEAPLSADWRGTDSFWSLCTQAEVDKAVQMVQEMRAKGALEDFYRENDGAYTVGPFSIVAATKCQ